MMQAIFLVAKNRERYSYTAKDENRREKQNRGDKICKARSPTSCSH